MRQTEIDKTRTCQLGRFDHRTRDGIRQQRVNNLLRKLARVAFGWLGQLHRHIGCNIAVRSDFGPLKNDVRRRFGQYAGHSSLQTGNNDVVLLGEHGLENDDLKAQIIA